MMHLWRPTSVLSCNKVHESDLAAHFTSKLLSSDKTLAQQNSGAGARHSVITNILSTILRSDGLQRGDQELLEAAAAEDGEAGGQCPPPVLGQPRCKQEISWGP